MQKIILNGLHFYRRAISPMLAPRCRFYPSCSAYAVEAVTTHGATRGSWLTFKRLCKCQPFHSGGIDLVPNKNATDVRGEIKHG